MKKAHTFARKVGTHVLVSGALALVMKRDTISGFHMVMVKYHISRQPEYCDVEWVHANRAVPLP